MPRAASAPAPGWPSVASLLYGAGFFVEARYAVPTLGHLIPVWLYYGLGVLLLGSLAAVLQKDLSPPRPASTPGGARHRACSLLGFRGADARGSPVAMFAVPTVFASLASVVTVVLARVLIKERVALHQWGGIAAVVAGLMLLDATP